MILYKIKTIFLCFIPIVKIGFTHNFLIKKRTAEFSSCSFSLLLILITAVSETCSTAILTDTDYL